MHWNGFNNEREVCCWVIVKFKKNVGKTRSHFILLLMVHLTERYCIYSIAVRMWNNLINHAVSRWSSSTLNT